MHKETIMNCWKSGCRRPAVVKLALAVHVDDHVYIPRCSEHWGDAVSDAGSHLHLFNEQANAELVTDRLFHE